VDNNKPTQQKNKSSRSEVEEPQHQHPIDIHFLPFKYQILDAPQVCKEMGGQQPEIRDKQSMEAIRFTAILKGVKKISAGINSNSNNVFRYIAGNTNAHYHSCEAWWFVQSYAVKYPIIYNHPGKEFVIRLGDANNKGYKDYMMCEVPKSTAKEQLKEENNLILQVIDHVCKRDEQGLVASTNIIINKIQAIANLNLTLLEEIQTMDHFFPKIIAYYNFDEDKKNTISEEIQKISHFKRNQPVFLLAFIKQMEEEIGKRQSWTSSSQHLPGV
jgi:hypothetical protein